MFELASRSWPWILARGIMAILLGIIALVWPSMTLVVLAIMIGIWLVMDGVGRLVNAFALRRLAGSDRLLIGLFGLLSLVAGVIALWNPFATLGALAILMAIWLIVAGVGEITTAIAIRKAVKGEWLLVISGILAIILGIVVFAMPGASLVTIALLVGINALILGIFLVVSAFRIRKLVKDQG